MQQSSTPSGLLRKVEGIKLCSQDNKKPPQQICTCHSYLLLEEGEAEAGASSYASWNASGTLVAVVSNGVVRVTVFNIVINRPVRQALFCHAESSPSHGMRHTMLA